LGVVEETKFFLIKDLVASLIFIINYKAKNNTIIKTRCCSRNYIVA
jgi:hypothetical protein